MMMVVAAPDCDGRAKSVELSPECSAGLFIHIAVKVEEKYLSRITNHTEKHASYPLVCIK
jgi:hypothetical protein